MAQDFNRQEREVALLTKQTVDFILLERDFPVDEQHTQNVLHLISGVMRNPEYLDDDLMGNVEPDFIKSPGLRRVWEGICHLKSLGIDPNEGTLHQHDWVAWRLLERLSGAEKWSDREAKWHAAKIIAEGIPPESIDPDDLAEFDRLANE